MERKCTGVEATLDIISGKWKPVILFHLFTNDKLRFGELKRALPEITQKMLTAQLRELEQNGIIKRKVYPQVPPKVEYSLTEYGETIMPILSTMNEWGNAHLEQHSEEKVTSL